MTEKATPRQAALWFAKNGHGVFPLHSVTDDGGCTCGDPACENAGKHPYAPFAPNGFKSAVTDPDVIKAWFDEHYWLNYGIHTEHLLVVDVDLKHNGIDNWSEMSRQPTRAVPHTWQVRTGSGGLHIIFRNTPGLRSGNLDNGIQIRAIGGYIVGPTCKHKSGGVYRWGHQCRPGEAPLAAPPGWLINVIKSRSHCGRPHSITEWRGLARTRLADGERHDKLNKLIGHFIGIGGDPVLVRDMMLGWKVGMCEPPISDKEIVNTVANIAEREIAKHKWIKE